MRSDDGERTTSYGNNGEESREQANNVDDRDGWESDCARFSAYSCCVAEEGRDWDRFRRKQRMRVVQDKSTDGTSTWREGSNGKVGVR